MPWLPIYATEIDMKEILEELNSDPEIAFILRKGNTVPKEWIAKTRTDDFSLEEYCLWHIPAGSLPLVSENNEIIGDSAWS